jgi:hypothetical protein
MHMVHHKSSLKNRIHSTLINFGRPARSATCSGPRGEGCWRGSTSPSPGARTSAPRLR